MRGPEDMRLVRRELTRGRPAVQRDALIVIQRTGAARSTANHKTLVDGLRAAFPGRKIVEFASPAKNLAEDIDLFRSAVAVVGVHGAGLNNMMFCDVGTTVVEVCYYQNCPEFYSWMALSLGLDYGISMGDGSYVGPVTAKVDSVVDVLREGGNL